MLMAEGTGLEPACPFGRRFSRPLHYQLCDPSDWPPNDDNLRVRAAQLRAFSLDLRLCVNLASRAFHAKARRKSKGAKNRSRRYPFIGVIDTPRLPVVAFACR